MTPLRTITQHVNDAPHTTPAKRGSKIGARAYCRNVISGRGLFRLNLNTPLEVAEWPVYAGIRNSSGFDKYFIFVF